MGIFDRLKHELIDIIEWMDDSSDTMVYRFDRFQNEIKNGAKLTVRPGQAAVFVNEGQIADVFQPGMYTLNTQNLPILATLKGWKYGFESPFKAEVYFVSTRNFTDRKWGTKNPVMLRDPEFGPIRLRAYGTYSIKIVDAGKFITEIAGTESHFTAGEITEQLKNIIVTRFSDTIGESGIPALDLASKYDDISDIVDKKVTEEFMEYGLDITKMLVENISFPPEVEEALDKRTSMGVIGDLNKYTTYQYANAMETAANNPAGAAGEGIGLGMGFAMANQMFRGAPGAPGTSSAPASAPEAAPPPLPHAVKFYVAVDGKQAGPFEEAVLKNMAAQGTLTRDSLVWTKGMAQWAKASEVEGTRNLFTEVPPPIPF